MHADAVTLQVIVGPVLLALAAYAAVADAGLRIAAGYGLTVADVARRYRVSPERVRRWIANGAILAINRRDTRTGRPSWVITPEALADFERGRAATPPPKQVRRKKRTSLVDYYPD
jgi:hypothetical protein